MATRLGIYNKALLYCGERRLATLTEDREPRYLLDDSWNDGAVEACVEDTDWAFLSTVVQSEPDASLEAGFGWSHVHNIPDNLLRLTGLYSDPGLSYPISQYFYDSNSNNFFVQQDTIYIQYVHNEYMDSIASWPRYFSNYVSGYLAFDVAHKLKNASDLKVVKDRFEDVQRIARSRDKQRKPTKRFPQGSWLSSQRGSGRDRPGGSWQ